MPHHRHRSRKLAKSNTRNISITSIALILSTIVFFSILAYSGISTHKDDESSNGRKAGKVLSFGDIGDDSVRDGAADRDSRDWDRDDRRRELGTKDELKVYEAEFEASLKNVGQLAEESVVDGDDDDDDDAIDSQDERMADLAKNGEEADKVLAGEGNVDFRTDSVVGGREGNGSGNGMGLDEGRLRKRRRVAGSSCEIKFINSTAQLVEPLESEKVSRFSLQYTEVEERPDGQEHWKPIFAGHQSLAEREESFYARDQRINCGFIKGPKGSPSTGFELEEDDLRYMRSCHIAVSSCIFGNSDNLRSPSGKTVTRLSRKNVCFVIFMDEITLQTLSSEGQKPDKLGYIGLWKIIVVNNLPYADMRRVGKIPKFLAHRLFPYARYSIWLDSKLRLQRDPLLILEYFLWRKGYEYAITNHYRRHCVWEEVAQNKRLNKFNHTIIDQQFLFYQADGLKRFNASDPNKLLPSNIPEGSFIVRAHTPMSNLFSCLWFNEVDRFTPRDQLSFAYVYHKLRRMNPEKSFHFKMFKDCERRAIAKLFHHRSEKERSIPFQAMG